MAQFAQFQSINVRPHARRNADKALQILRCRNGKLTLTEFATNALNERACRVIREAGLKPELPIK